MATKVAIVSGGAQGLGKAISAALLKAGYKVGIFDINDTVGKQTADELSSQFGSGSCVFFKCDVTEAEQLKGCYDNVHEHLGSISVVVNNAGVVDERNWNKIIDVNMRAVVESTYLAVDRMRKDKGGNGGTIVNISSGAGMIPYKGLAVYPATKWAVIGFTKSMAESVTLAEEDWGISFLTLCPGYVDTPSLWSAGRDGLDAMVVSPAVPEMPCKKHLSERFHQSETMSLDEVAGPFEKLLRDNKNGSVMRFKKEDGFVKTSYVEQKWTDM